MNQIVASLGEAPMWASLLTVAGTLAIGAWVAQAEAAPRVYALVALPVVLVTSACWVTSSPGWHSALAIGATALLFLASMLAKKKYRFWFAGAALVAALATKPVAALVGAVLDWLMANRTLTAPGLVWALLLLLLFAAAFGIGRGRKRTPPTPRPQAEAAEAS